MFTVAVCFEASGKSSTRRPLPRRYSVIPSTVAPRTGAAPFAGAAAFGDASADEAKARAARAERKDFIGKPPAAGGNAGRVRAATDGGTSGKSSGRPLG